MESAKNRKRPGESEGVGEKRERRNEKERARRRAETKDEKEARLAKMRDRHRASVWYSRDSSRESYQTEAQEYISQQQCLATETNEERTAILHDMRASQQQCLATESQEVRNVRLNHLWVRRTELLHSTGGTPWNRSMLHMHGAGLEVNSRMKCMCH